MRQRLIDVKAVGVILDRCTRTIARDDIAGRIPAPVWVGGSKRWRVLELELWVAAGCPLRADWEARKHQPVEAGQPSVIDDPKVASAANDRSDVSPKERDLDDFKRFIAAGCTRDEWEQRKRQSGADNQAKPSVSKTS